MKNSLILKWEKIGMLLSGILLVVVIIMEMCATFWFKNYPTITSIVTGLACGFIATIIVLYIQRKYEKTEAYRYYLKYAGTYYRTDIGQDNTVESNLVNMRQENNGLVIEMTYLGRNEFSLLIDYWKSEKAQAKGFVEFNPNDKHSGKGNYRYIAGKNYEGQFGNLELNWDENNSEMIVIYRHQYPREIPFNPDNNRGWEVWTKVTNSD